MALSANPASALNRPSSGRVSRQNAKCTGTNHIAARSGPSSRRCLIVCYRSHLGTRTGDRNGQPAPPHDGQIDNVIANVGDLFFAKAVFRQDFVQNLGLVGCALKEKIDLQVTSA